MNKTLINVLMFTAGAAIGSLVTWKVMKTTQEREIQEEVDSFKKYWKDYMKDKTHSGDICCEHGCTDRKSSKDESFEDDNEPYDPDQQTLFAYHNLTKAYDSSGEETENDEEGDRDEDISYINGPIIITPDEFGDGDYDHDLKYLTYYEDGVLADDWGVEYDVDETIDEDSLEHFGDYARDTLHIRNERTRCDYEVTRDYRRYSEIEFNESLN